MNLYDNTQNAEITALLLTKDLACVGNITCVRRFDGWALLDSSVMFGFVGEYSDLFLRANGSTAARFAALGSTKHTDMPYWSIPAQVRADIAALRHLAYEAADIAHLALSPAI